MNLVNPIYFLLAFITLGCNQEATPRKSVVQKENEINNNKMLVTVDSKIDRFNVTDKSFKECLKILIDTSNPSFELENRLIFIESWEEDLSDENSHSISLDLHDIPIGKLLDHLVTAGEKSLSYRILDSGEVTAIIICPLSLSTEVLNYQDGRMNNHKRPITVDSKIDHFNVSDKSFKECLEILIDTSDSSFELGKRIIFFNLREEDSNSAKINIDLHDIPIGKLLEHLVTVGTKSLSYRVLDSGEVSAIIIAPLGLYPAVLTSQ